MGLYNFQIYILKIYEKRSYVPVGFAVLTVSDTRTIDEDRSGTVLADRIATAGHRLVARELTTDDVRKIRAIVRRWIADPDAGPHGCIGAGRCDELGKHDEAIRRVRGASGARDLRPMGRII